MYRSTLSVLNWMEMLNIQENERQYEVLINAKNEKSSGKNSISASVIEFLARYWFVFELWEGQMGTRIWIFFYSDICENSCSVTVEICAKAGPTCKFSYIVWYLLDLPFPHSMPPTCLSDSIVLYIRERVEMEVRFFFLKYYTENKKRLHSLDVINNPL